MGDLDGLKILASPQVFASSAIQQWSVELSKGSPQWENLLARTELIPPELARAAPKRRAEFVAGRLCAAEALRAAGAAAGAGAAIGIGSTRAPLWPAGFVGAITHTEGFVSAAVAPSASVGGVGLDTERRMRPEVAAEVREKILTPGDERFLKSAPAGWLREDLITLLFSAKESVYKCLAPAVGRYFDFQEVEFASADFGRGEFVARFLTDLSAAHKAGHSLRGRFVRDEVFIHTGVEF